MSRTIAPKDRLLVSFTEAQNLLSVSKMELLRLIAQGVITPHPVLDRKIAVQQLEDFALNYGHANPDAEERRTVPDGPAVEAWDTPSLRLR